MSHRIRVRGDSHKSVSQRISHDIHLVCHRLLVGICMTHRATGKGLRL